MEKKGQGRKKTSMQKIDKESNLLVTFSKRHASLFKKACELSILCGVNVALIIFSPKNKVYTFGSPSVDMIVKHYLAISNVDNNFDGLRMRSIQNLILDRLTTELNEVEEKLSIHKDGGKLLDDFVKACEGQYWWDGLNKDKLTLEQLNLLKEMMEVLKNDVENEKHKMCFDSNNRVGELQINASTFIDSYDGILIPNEYAFASGEIPNPSPNNMSGMV